jgi:hypothetical protein
MSTQFFEADLILQWAMKQVMICLAETLTLEQKKASGLKLAWGNVQHPACKRLSRPCKRKRYLSTVIFDPGQYPFCIWCPQTFGAPSHSGWHILAACEWYIYGRILTHASHGIASSIKAVSVGSRTSLRHFAHSDEIVHEFRGCRPPVRAKRRWHQHYTIKRSAWARQNRPCAVTRL